MDEDVHASNPDADYLRSGDETSPILDRHTVRHRTPRNIVSSSGWISTLSSRQVSRVMSEHGAASSNSDALNESSGPLNQNEDRSSDNPPPIEDTDLIMIHRPVSPHHPTVEDPGDIQEINPNAHGEPDNVMHVVIEANRPATPPPGTSSDISPLDAAAGPDQNPETDEVISLISHDDPIESPTFPPRSSGPDVENLPLAERIRSPDLLPPERSPPPKKKKIEPEVKIVDDNFEEEEGNICSICLDAWTNSGDHRLVALRCGHLFGQHCIGHWLQIHKSNDRRCPQCKKKATVKDIRPLYASKIRVLDTSEHEALKETIKKLEQEKERLTRELAYERQLNQEAIKIQLEQQLQLQHLQNGGILTPSVHLQLPATSKQIAAIASQIKINQTNRIEISRDGGCRVLAFNEWKGVLVASQSAVTPLFPDFGIRLIDTEDFRLRQSIPMHLKAIRDLSFNPHRKDLLLSASLDKTAKVFCMSSSASVMTFNTEVPLWSCCWDGHNSNLFFAGSQNGITLQYDIRNTHTEVSRIVTPGDGTPVISLAAIPAGSWLPNGGFLSCRLNRLRVYERTSNFEFRPYPLSIDGPFSALTYDHKTQHMLVSTRPTSQNPHAQHQLYEMGFTASQPQTNIVHSFVGGTTQRVMSRPCQIDFDGNVKDKLICAHQESEGHVAIWSVKTGQKVPAGPLHASEAIMDLCPVKVNNRSFLASLSEKVLRVYQLS